MRMIKVHLNSRIRVESRPYLRGKVCQRRTSTMMKMKPVTMIWMGLMRGELLWSSSWPGNWTGRREWMSFRWRSWVLCRWWWESSCRLVWWWCFEEWVLSTFKLQLLLNSSKHQTSNIKQLVLIVDKLAVGERWLRKVYYVCYCCEMYYNKLS